jgi:hypothetical protein
MRPDKSTCIAGIVRCKWIGDSCPYEPDRHHGLRNICLPLPTIDGVLDMSSHTFHHALSEMLVSFIPSTASRCTPVQRLAERNDASLADVAGDAVGRNYVAAQLVRLAQSHGDDEVISEAKVEVPQTAYVVCVDAVEVLLDLDGPALLVRR